MTHRIRTGDRVKISLYGLPESDWLEVDAVDAEPYAVTVAVVMPNTTRRRVYSSEVTAHEPAAPALPEWWGARVVFRQLNGYCYYETWDRVQEDYRDEYGHLIDPEEYADSDVTVVVDRDGNQPADNWKIAYLNVNDERAEYREERDEARADLAALRAKVAKVRDFLASRADEHLRHDHHSFDRGAAYVGHDAADRLSAILDGTDQ